MSRFGSDDSPGSPPVDKEVVRARHRRPDSDHAAAAGVIRPAREVPEPSTDSAGADDPHIPDAMRAPPTAAAAPPAASGAAVLRQAPSAPAEPPGGAALRPPDAAPAAAPANTARPSMAAAATTHARMAATAQAQVHARALAQATAQATAAVVTAVPPRAPASQPARRVVSDADRLAVSLEAQPPRADPPAGVPGRPYRPRRPHTLFGVHVGQIITWQVAVLAFLLVLQQPPLPGTVVGAIALLSLILTAIPVHGRWLFQWVALWIRYAVRRRRRTVPASDHGAFRVLLRTVTRGGEIGTLDIDGASFALIRHAGGLTVVLAPTAITSALVSETDESMLPLTELLPPADEGEFVVSAQIVVHSMPAPRPSLGDSAAAISYRALSGGSVPAQRRCWIALQALRTTDDHTDDALREALTIAVRRLQRRLRKAGMRGHILSRDEAVTDLLELAGLHSAPSGGPSGARPRGTVIREGWHTWSVGDEIQTTFRIADWPDLGHAHTRNFLDVLMAIPSRSNTVAVAVRRHGDEVELEAALRMTLIDADAMRETTLHVEAVAHRAGARVRRLDGEQVFGAAASLPIGGFLA